MRPVRDPIPLFFHLTPSGNQRLPSIGRLTVSEDSYGTPGLPLPSLLPRTAGVRPSHFKTRWTPYQENSAASRAERDPSSVPQPSRAPQGECRRRASCPCPGPGRDDASKRPPASWSPPRPPARRHRPGKDWDRAWQSPDSESIAEAPQSTQEPGNIETQIASLISWNPADALDLLAQVASHDIEEPDPTAASRSVHPDGLPVDSHHSAANSLYSPQYRWIPNRRRMPRTSFAYIESATIHTFPDSIQGDLRKQ